MRNRKGFTLAELLIVVAIIGVLVAVSIPVFTSQLEKSRIAVDQANVRSAKAAAVAEYLTDGVFETKTYYYTSSGTVQDTNAGITGYGKSTKEDPDGTITGATTAVGAAPKDGYVSVTISTDGTITAAWNGGGASSGGGSGSGSGSSSTNVLFDVKSSDKVYDWNKIDNEAKGNGTQIYAGTLLVGSDGTQYVAFTTDSWVSTVGISSVEELVDRYSNKIKKLDKSDVLEVETDLKNKGTLQQGTIALYNGKYYALKDTITYNAYYGPIPASDGNWVVIAGQD